MSFFHIIVELKKLKITFAIEKVYIFRKFIYAEFRYLTKIEKHYIQYNDRLIKGKAILGNYIAFYSGYVPYWIENRNLVKIYDQSFYRLFGRIYYSFKGESKGIFIFNKKLEEIFCARLFKKDNFKVIIRV